ncbi:hypothetical protein HWV62_14294 [Athelia sp. TMB]|nr:hypothetical protein HWV62_14294 [Athelia sp. TMB]
MASKQDELLAQFRQILTDEGLIHDGDSIGTDDSTLKRFLRARKYNLRDAKKMWSDCQHWRNTVEGVGIDELYQTLDPFDVSPPVPRSPPANIAQYPERDKVFKSWPMWFHKTDKEGHPLNVHFFGGMNMPELYKHISPAGHWRTVLVNCEALTREILPAASRAAGRPVGQTFVIVDLKGFSLSQFWQVKALARSSFQVSQDYYPETMGRLAIVNAPSSFTFIWGIMKPWLSKETVAKVDILGADYREVLLERVDADSLPASLGGACRCEGGCEYSFAGPWKEGTEERRARRRREAGGVKEAETEMVVDAAPEAASEKVVDAALETPNEKVAEADAASTDATPVSGSIASLDKAQARVKAVEVPQAAMPVATAA